MSSSQLPSFDIKGICEYTPGSSKLSRVKYNLFEFKEDVELMEVKPHSMISVENARDIQVSNFSQVNSLFKYIYIYIYM